MNADNKKTRPSAQHIGPGGLTCPCCVRNDSPRQAKKRANRFDRRTRKIAIKNSHS